MKKLILVSVLLFNVNVMGVEYNVVCDKGYHSVVIRDIEDFELAKEIANQLDKKSCKIIIVKM